MDGYYGYNHLASTHGRRHVFESGGGAILLAPLAKIIFGPPPLFGQWGGGQNIAHIAKSA